MNLLDLDWEIILLILKQYNDYKYCIRVLMICKQLYNNELLMREIKNHFTEYRVNEYRGQKWYFNGILHREDDKPALIISNRGQSWYYNARLRYKYYDHTNIPITQEWWFKGKLHRENDKPAIITSDGYKVWYFNDKIHRDNDKPAVIYGDGTKNWYLNNKLHRENGPAIEYFNGYKEWYLNDKRYSEKGYWIEMKKINSLKN